MAVRVPTSVAVELIEVAPVVVALDSAVVAKVVAIIGADEVLDVAESPVVGPVGVLVDDDSLVASELVEFSLVPKPVELEGLPWLRNVVHVQRTSFMKLLEHCPVGPVYLAHIYRQGVAVGFKTTGNIATTITQPEVGEGLSHKHSNYITHCS